MRGFHREGSQHKPITTRECKNLRLFSKTVLTDLLRGFVLPLTLRMLGNFVIDGGDVVLVLVVVGITTA